jgi:OFA family oxalate/formate antiporter-like MFS transporter
MRSRRLKRYLILLAAVVMQICMGATYSWSVYVQPLKNFTGMLQGTLQVPFTLFYFAFPATMFFAGSLLRRLGPRLCAVCGGLVFGGGWLVAGFGDRHFLLTVLGIGLLGGIGVGLAYIVPIATCIQWFPKNKGLVTGIAVAGFGGGAALVSQLANLWMSAHGATPFETFATFGVVFLVLVPAAGLSMQPPPSHPPPRAGSAGGSGPPRAGRSFRLLYLAMFTGLAAGFAVNANLKELYAGSAVQAGVAAVGLFALANAAGRISWGLAFDRMSSAGAIQANLLCQALVLLAAPWILRSTAGLMVFAVMTGFNYGGVLVVYASASARKWGAENVGQIYGRLFSANIPAALSPIAAGYAFDALGNFNLPLGVIGGLLLLAAALVRRAGSHIDS